MDWFSIIVLLIIASVFYKKLNTQLNQLRGDITKLQIELQQYKDNAKALKPSDSIANHTTQSTLSSTAAPQPILPPPLPTKVSSADEQPNPVLSEHFVDNTPIIKALPVDPKPASSQPVSTTPIMEPDEHSLPIVTSLFNSLKNWFLGGNMVVRVGVLVLLVGVVLLLRLVSDYVEISIESKLIAIGVTGLALAGLGLKLAYRRFAYGITLQGAGLAIAYLTTFFAYDVYEVLASVPSFIALGLISALTIGLAVRQNAFPLALLALGGGFFAPLLTATDTGSLTTLFSYYLLLNVAVAIIAHYRTWKVLNILGVAVTFGLAYYFGGFANVSSEIDEQRWSLVLLVALHLALYLFIAIRYTQQIITYNINYEAASYNTTATTASASNAKPVHSLYLYPMDIGLLFSVPVLAFGLFAALLHDIDHALTITSAILGAIYLILGWLLIKSSQRYALITEGMLALGFGFLALVIPLAFDAEWIAVGWSIQGVALVWFGRRSLRAWLVIFGLLLQLGSVALLTLYTFFDDATTLATSLSAVAGLGAMFILRASNSPNVLLATTSQTNANILHTTNAINNPDDTDNEVTKYASALGISPKAARQWLMSINHQTTAFNVVWRSPVFIRFLTFIAMIWALYVGVTHFEQWLSRQQVATTTLIALSSLLSVSGYWLMNRYRPWQEIRALSQGVLVVFYAMLILQLPQKFEFSYQWNSVNWMLFTVLLIGGLSVGQLWLKTWYQHDQLSRFDSASWLGTGVLVLDAAVHYGLPDSQGVMTILIPVALMLAGLALSYRYDARHDTRHDESATRHAINHNANPALGYWFDWQQALIDCAKIFVPMTLFWVIITNRSYDGVIWNLPYFPLVNLYDMSLWLVLIYGLSIIYLRHKALNTPQPSIDPKNPTTNKANSKAFNPKPMLIILGIISFWVISSMLIRTLHAFIDTPLWHQYPLGAWSSEQVQTGLTILWTLIALVATIIASRQLKRTPWFMGIGLLGVVVLKLVLVDLSQTEAIWRVLSFLVAGSLILLIGYLAPLPPEKIEKDAEV